VPYSKLLERRETGGGIKPGSQQRRPILKGSGRNP
jgi:hypothetical protein